MEFMTPQRDGEAQWKRIAGRLVEFLQFGAKARNLNSYRGVRLGIKIRRSPERIDCNGVLADRFAVMLPQIEEQRPHHRRGSKCVALDDPRDEFVQLSRRPGAAWLVPRLSAEYLHPGIILQQSSRVCKRLFCNHVSKPRKRRATP